MPEKNLAKMDSLLFTHMHSSALCFKAQNTQSIPTYMAGAFAIGTESQIINTAVM